MAAACALRRRRLITALAAVPALGAIAALAATIAIDSPNLPMELCGRVKRVPPSTAALAVEAHLDKTPVRTPGELELTRNGWTYDCMECHALLNARWRYNRPLNEHRDIALEHGNNRYCLNCHHAANRNAFADYDGAEIAPLDVVQLCAKCHGTIFRDWEAGVHGRRNGYWNAWGGTQTTLRCSQCHDPHRPKFPAMKPMPPLRYPARAAGALHPPTGPAFAGSESSASPASIQTGSPSTRNPKPETRSQAGPRVAGNPGAQP